MAFVSYIKVNLVIPELCDEVEMMTQVFFWHRLEGIGGNTIESRGLVIGQFLDVANEICSQGRNVELTHNLL